MATPTLPAVPCDEICFVRTRHVYDSYRDFWRLVEAAEFLTCYVDEIDPDRDVTYVFTPLNGEMTLALLGRDKRRARIVWWNLERPEDKTHAKSLETYARKLDAIWVSDRHYATLSPHYRFVLMAGHRKLWQPRQSADANPEKIYDVCHLAYLWGRREDAIEKLRAAGLTIAPPAWGGDEQDVTLPRARLMLNLHQYPDLPIVAPIRFAIAASYQLPIASEWFRDHDALPLVIISQQLPYLLKTVQKELVPTNRNKLELAGADLYRRLCIWTDFRKEVEKAVEMLRLERLLR